VEPQTRSGKSRVERNSERVNAPAGRSTHFYATAIYLRARAPSFKSHEAGKEEGRETMEDFQLKKMQGLDQQNLDIWGNV